MVTVKEKVSLAWRFRKQIPCLWRWRKTLKKIAYCLTCQCCLGGDRHGERKKLTSEDSKNYSTHETHDPTTNTTAAATTTTTTTTAASTIATTTKKITKNVKGVAHKLKKDKD